MPFVWRVHATGEGSVCLVHLYALEGAICNTEYNCLSEEKKQELKEFSDFLK